MIPGGNTGFCPVSVGIAALNRRLNPGCIPAGYPPCCNPGGCGLPSRRPYCYAICTDTQAGVGASGSSPVSHVARSCRRTGKKKRLQGMLAASKGAVTYSPTFAVPSAWRGLTSLFGMGRGGAPALSPPWSFAFVLRHARHGMTGVSQERRRSVTWKRTQEPSRISRDSLFL